VTSRPSCRRTDRRRRRWKKHIWATRETCSRIDSSESNSTPRFRTQLAGLIVLWPTVMVLLFGERRRSSDVEPNHSSSVLSAFSCSLFILSTPVRDINDAALQMSHHRISIMWSATATELCMSSNRRRCRSWRSKTSQTSSTYSVNNRRPSAEPIHYISVFISSWEPC